MLGFGAEDGVVRCVGCSAGGFFQASPILRIYLSRAASSFTAATAKPGRWPGMKPCMSVPPSARPSARRISTRQMIHERQGDTNAPTVGDDVVVVRQRTSVSIQSSAPAVSCLHSSSIGFGVASRCDVLGELPATPFGVEGHGGGLDLAMTRHHGSNRGRTGSCPSSRQCAAQPQEQFARSSEPRLP